MSSLYLQSGVAVGVVVGDVYSSISVCIWMSYLYLQSGVAVWVVVGDV